MPDHVHLLLDPVDDVSLTRVVGDIKSVSAHRINRALARRGAVWQAESFDHILRSNEKVLEKAEYILNNPVRKGMVREAREWPWFWSAYQV